IIVLRIHSLATLFPYTTLFRSEWSSYPMDYIDSLFASFSEWASNTLPPGTLTDLIAEGIIPGLGGIVIFIPQIAFLFLFIAILRSEEHTSELQSRENLVCRLLL